MSVNKWPSLSEVIQKIINHSSSKQLGKNKEGNMLSPVEVFTALKPSHILIKPMPLRKFRNIEAMNEEGMKDLVSITKLQEALTQRHKDAAQSKAIRGTHAKQLHNTKTNVLPVNIVVGDHVMVRAHASRTHKLQTKSRGLMIVKEAKSSLMFVVEDVVSGELHTIHAQRMMLYPVTQRGSHASEELRQKAVHYNATCHLIDEIIGVGKRKEGYELRIRWVGFHGDDHMAWKPLKNNRYDVSGILEDFLHTPGDRNLKKKIIDIYF